MEKINGRTPEQIERILQWFNFDCSDHECDSCPNEDICNLQNGNESVLARDALAYIERLKSERDAALADMKGSRICALCAHWEAGINEPCMHCTFENNCFEWRGIKSPEEDAHD